MDLTEHLEKVRDKETFLAFVRALQMDKEDESRKEKRNHSNPYSHGWNGWENSTIEGFLESAIAWAEDSDFGNNIEPTDNHWKMFALFLYGGKIYE
ncbi:MAG: hypothetical protein KZQ80_14595 [Candidatus Thiodiazotropha sp. (ex Monitilora ramsayi)]|nr:hypothetical protein [Candidatus Thiodiazotropha sp. (ex Monitilora ramsayi)]